MTPEETARGEVERLVVQDGARLRASLIGILGDFDLAEEMLQEALAVALESWARDGVPGNPRAWVISTARFKAIDAIRRRSTWRAKSALLLRELPRAEEPAALDDPGFAGDDRLRLLFTCCHPALSEEARIALTLRTLGGLTTEEIARAFLVETPTMAQRIVRAQRKIQNAGIPYRVPEPAELAERLEGVAHVVYLIFNEGHTATAGDQLVRRDLCNEAIRLARLLVELQPCEMTFSLLALLLLHDSRRDTRIDEQGNLVRLDEQERSRWDRTRIAEGLGWVERALRIRSTRGPGRFALEAAIAAVHAEAHRPEETDWRQIRGIYDVLMRLHPSPVAELNRAIALGMEQGPEAGLRALEVLKARRALDGYHRLPAAEAELLRRANRLQEAREAYRQALAQTINGAERRFLTRRLGELESQP